MLYCLHLHTIIVHATRLPMEIFEVTSSSSGGGGAHSGQQQHRTSTAPDEKKVLIRLNSATSEQRKGRQIEEITVPRILYQVGVRSIV